jgi:hypothetical protein
MMHLLPVTRLRLAAAEALVSQQLRALSGATNVLENSQTLGRLAVVVLGPCGSRVRSRARQPGTFPNDWRVGKPHQ